jgi:hypothetical protein
MVKGKKIPAKIKEPEKPVSFKDMNSMAREEFIQLIKTDTSLTPTWKDTITPLISKEIPDDLSPLQILIDGIPHVKTETTQG